MNTTDKEDQNIPDLKTPQDAGAPQDENPDGPGETTRPKPDPLPSRKRKPRVKPGTNDKKEDKLLSEDTDIHDETTI
jgi:hypothetical protein